MGNQDKLAGRTRGSMTDDDKKKIIFLAETMKKPTAGKIAAAINRHPATVNWFMLTRGLVDRKPGRAHHPYMRNGKMIYPYSEEHDAFIESMRAQGKVFREIGEAVTARFGIERDAHSVQVRIIQLAASPEN